ncbi:MAG: acetyl-CoA carboxylase carboxyltransferase subunit alpha [Deltaproteobacteria bacterium]|nr:acetyl-CoA carboxylase carboxyltransferase subunit alpha [Deltaproteobacteria bacterium]MCL5791748.1 acetyl-CoA carboxylase carboxyltransferase subunit alpha [Deltaproteobacteria bacterium]
MIHQPLDFEKPIHELEKKIEEFKQLSSAEGIELSDEIEKLEKKLKKLREDIFNNLDAWKIVQLSRHQERPYTWDYIYLIFDEFVELHGDRLFRDDTAMVTGIGTIAGMRVVLIGEQKGRGSKERMYRNFGMPHPEGYRKAIRIMKLAEKFQIPIITIIDTPGAYPGIGAEERGQADAISSSILTMSGIRVPTVGCIIGEGSSGGALAIGLVDRLLMLEYAIYSVISPEGCAAILWKDKARTSQAAETLKLTSDELKKAGIIDEILKEPPGGAHTDYKQMAQTIKDALIKHTKELSSMPVNELVENRYKRYRAVGVFKE